MGSQTLEILRQGVWASLTGGWFYDPHQSVFCNVVHMYLWLFLLCSPFVAYLYFPSTWFTWYTYCVVISVTMFTLKLANMALHLLYDKAQNTSENNITQNFFKVTEEGNGASRDHESGIEMKVMRGNGLCNSADQAINEISGGNSMISIENVNNIIDLKVDVHRKNSSESIELMFYAPSMISDNSQNDQQSLAGTAVDSKCILSSHTIKNSETKEPITTTKYLMTYPNDQSPKNNGTSMNITANSNSTQSQTQSQVIHLNPRQPRLLRKSSEVIKGHLRRRIERQNSLDAAAESTIVAKLMRQSIDDSSGAPQTERFESFLHSQVLKADSSCSSTGNSALLQQHQQPHSQLAKEKSNTMIPTTLVASTAASNLATNTLSTKNLRLQRHRSSETHDECMKAQQRNLNMVSRLPEQQPTSISSSSHHHHHHHRHHHHPHMHRRGGSGGGQHISSSGALNVDELELGLGSSTGSVATDTRMRALKSWILGSSSDVFIEDNSYTKSDLGIEQLNDYNTPDSSHASLLLHKHQQHQLNSHLHSHQQQQFRLRNPHQYHGGANIHKDSTSTMSALQLPVAAAATLTYRNAIPPERSEANNSNSKRRRHSNATTAFQRPMGGSSSNTTVCQDSSSTGNCVVTSTVRRIKSAALEINCARPSVSNLYPHPNSVEAISGQQQIKNPENSLLPPPSKCLVRNQHLNLCPQLGSNSRGSTMGGRGASFGDSSTTSSLDFASNNVLIDTLRANKTQSCDAKKQRQLKNTKSRSNIQEVHDGDSKSSVCEYDLARSKGRDHERENCLDLPEASDQDSLGAVGGATTCPIYYHSSQPKHQHQQQPHQHSAEADVGDFLNDKMCGDDDGEDAEDEIGEIKDNDLEDDEEADDNIDDEFKDFDYDVEHILQDLQLTQNQLDADLRAQQDNHKILALPSGEEASKSNDINIDGSNVEADVNDNNDGYDSKDSAGVLRERLHSTDSETDNNGSRSPLLSGKKWERTKSQMEKTLRTEVQQSSIHSSKLNEKHKEPAENCTASAGRVGCSISRQLVDSGCPSSDCEQTSASSKDMLLAGMDCDNDDDDDDDDESVEIKSKCEDGETSKKLSFIPAENNESGGKDGFYQSQNGGLDGTANKKSLGAIPKIVQCREVDELQFKSKTAGTISKMVKRREADEVDFKGRARGSEGAKMSQHHREVNDMEFKSKAAAAIVQMHKRHAGNWTAVAPCNGADGNTLSGTKAISCNSSSSTSSHSVSAEPLSADIHKVLWLMQGGGAAGVQGYQTDRDGGGNAIVPLQPHPPTASSSTSTHMSSAHLQLYQDAFKALNIASSAERLALNERLYYREQLLRRREQRESAEVSHHSNTLDIVPMSESNAVLSSINSRPSASLLGVVAGGTLTSPSSAASALLNNRNISNATTISLQGFFQDITSDELRAMGPSGGGGRIGSAMSGGNSGVNSATAGILNVDGHHLENYCDFWRPACLLGAEKQSVPPKSFYKYRFECCGFAHEFKISMDRLELLALFDRDLYWFHIVVAVLLSTLVAHLGACILQHNYYKDIFAFFFCAVIAGSQYSLLKSVQPDAASPIHGFNKTVSYSRSIYFCLCSALLLLLKRIHERHDNLRLNGIEPSSLVLFGITFSPAELNNFVLEGLYIFLLSFPVIFSLGLFPQINTFLMYFMEQVDMHVFGGNAAGSLLGSFMCVCRSMWGISILYGPLHAALAEAKGTQNILFSIFCALLVPMGYHLSRSASDFSNTWAIIKHCIMSTYHDDDDELSNTTSITSNQKFTPSTPKGGADGSQKPEASETMEMPSLKKNGEVGTQEGQEEKPGKGLKEDDGTEELVQAQKRSKSKTSSGSSQTLNKSLKKTTTVSSSSCGSNHVDDEPPSKITIHNENVAATEADKMSSTNSTTQPAETSTCTAGLNEPLPSEEFNLNRVDDLAADCNDSADPLPKKLQQTVNARLKNDVVVSIFLAVVVLSLHCSTIFTVLQPDLNVVLYSFTGSFGFLLHYIIPQMRKHMPWLCFARPLLKQKEYGRYEVSHAPQIMWFEKFYIYMCMLEKNVLFPLLVISALTADAVPITNKYGIGWGALIIAVCGMKFIRNAYSDPTNQYLIVVFTVLIFSIDFAFASETFLIDYFFVSMVFRKCCDFLLKLQFIVTYIAPWQITWGSAFHAFAQPFSVPHSAMLFLQAGVSAILSTPLNPFLGSAIFLTSYVRPIKFWERDYNTRRIDHSNTRLSSQLERDLGADDNNLNSIFYEHLTRSLQHSLCGDLLMGRWGNVNQGDCFVLASDYLNCLVHVIELGNGLCTFQIRGLEFRGTYCQQREVEAITEDVEDNDGCCCCDPGHLPRMLSANAMFSTRWLAWQVVAAQYVVEGYSISDNLASATLQVFEYRKVLITYYIKSIIYYVMKNAKLDEWVTSTPIQDALQHTLSRQFVDLDPIFNFNLDEDFDFRAIGITRSSFCYVYLSWINFCYDKRKEVQSQQLQPTIVTTQPQNIITMSVPVTTSLPANTNGSVTAASTPNLSNTQQKSLSQQQLRVLPQKSAVVTGSGDGVVINFTDTMAVSHSLANISRQASESVPGLSNTPLTRSTKSAPVGGGRHLQQQRRDDGGSSPGGRVGCAETSRAGSEKPPLNKLKVPSIAKDSPIVSLCLALSLLARRSLATASHSSLTGVEFFLHGLHALFKGDFRITSPRDEWVFADMDLLHAVVAPAVKMALKLQQDHISNPDEFRDPLALYEAIDSCAKDLVISHEADPVWRSAVLRGAPNLLALRHVLEDGSDEYRIIRLSKRFLTFRVIKLNRECVRGLWAGQQQELIYLRNRNPERGSIQNAKQALRNIINSSCDQPIGYPIYVSPLTTSYADTNEQLREVIGGPITPEAIKDNVLQWWHHIREKCRQGCSSGSVMETAHFGLPSTVCSNLGESGDLRPVYISPPIYNTLTVNNGVFARVNGSTGIQGASLGNQFGNEGLASVRANLAGMPVKPNSTTLLAGFLSRDQELLREVRTSNKGGHFSNSSSRSDRERRATLPSTSCALSETGKDSGESSQTLDKDTSTDSMIVGVSAAVLNNSPRCTKVYCSSGNLGIGNIITTPGEYPRKTKGPICLTAAAAGMMPQASTPFGMEVNATGKTRLGLFERVILVDEEEVYDGLDERRNFVWPYEAMRLRGGRISWKGWLPRIGMMGVVVHIWTPNNPDITQRSIINSDLYLMEIGDYYVPVTEKGLRLFTSVTDNSIKELERSRRNSLQREILELRQLQQQQHTHLMERVLTPILGSSLDSPTSQLANGTVGDDIGTLSTVSTPRLTCDNTKIRAVSSSSSEDESDLLRLELQRRAHFFNMWKQITEKQTNAASNSREECESKDYNIPTISTTPHQEEKDESNLLGTTHAEGANEMATFLNTPSPSERVKCEEINNKQNITHNADDSPAANSTTALSDNGSNENKQQTDSFFEV